MNPTYAHIGHSQASMEREAALLWDNATPQQRKNVVLILAQVLREENLWLRPNPQKGGQA